MSQNWKYLSQTMKCRSFKLRNFRFTCRESWTFTSLTKMKKKKTKNMDKILRQAVLVNTWQTKNF